MNQNYDERDLPAIDAEYLQAFCMTYVASFLSLVLQKCKSRNITINELAQRIGVDHAALYRIFRAQRKPSVETLLRMACVLDIDLSAKEIIDSELWSLKPLE